MKKKGWKKLALKAIRQREDAMLIADGWRQRAEAMHKKSLAARELLNELEMKVAAADGTLFEKARQRVEEFVKAAASTELWMHAHGNKEPG